MLILESVILPGVVVPAAAALIGLLTARMLLGRGAARPGGPGGALPLGLAFLAAYVAISGWPRWLPVEATQRLFYFVAIAALLAAPLARLGRGVRLAAMFAFATPATALLLQGQIQHRWSIAQSVLWVAGLGALGVVLAAAWAQSTIRPFQTSHPTTTTWHDALLRPALIGCAALALGLSGSALLGQLMGAVAVGALVIGVAEWFSRPIWLPSDALVWQLAVGGLVMLGFFYSELGALPAILLVLSLILLAAQHQGSAPPRKLLILLPALVAAGLIVYGVATAPPDPYAGYGDYGASGL